MNAHVIATVLGIVIQAGGAAYVVVKAKSTADLLGKYKSNITYDTFAHAIDDLAHEMHGQFKLQLRGFAMLALGSTLQLYGAIPAA